MRQEAEQFWNFIGTTLAESTRAMYRDELVKFSACVSDKPPADLTLTDISDYMNHLLNTRHLSNNKAIWCMILIKRFVAWMEDMEIIETGKIKLRLLPKIPKTKLERLPVTHHQYKMLLRVAGNRQRYKECFQSAIIIGWNTGMRFSDVVGMPWTAVDFEKRVLVFSVQKNARFKQVLTVPMEPELHDHLLMLWNIRRPTSKLVLPDLHAIAHMKSGRQWITLQLRHIFDSAGMPNHSFHTLRHGAVTRMINQGVNPVIIGSITGQSLSTVAHYSHPSVDAKREALRSARHARPVFEETENGIPEVNTSA